MPSSGNIEKALGRTPSSLRALFSHLAAAGIISAATVIASLAQYEVDYEVTLLPWLINRGWVIYRDIADQHPPLLPALLSPFGGDPGPMLHALIVVQHLALLCLTYMLARRLFGWTAGLLSLVTVEVWSVAFDSMRLWYDSVLGLVYLVMLLVFTNNKESGQERSVPRIVYEPAAVGMLMSAALLIKQHALLAVPFVAAAVWYTSGPEWKRTLLGFLLGMAVPLAVAVLLLFAGGAESASWYWIVEYSLTSNYADVAARSPGPGEWWKLAGFSLPVVAMFLTFRREVRGLPPAVLPAVLIAGAGFLLAGLVPAWPRYGAFHLQAAVPLMGIFAGGVLFRALDAVRGRRIRHCFGAVAALMLLCLYALAGIGQWVSAVQTYLYLGPARAPYVDTIVRLREWVATNGAGLPVFIYGLDPLLYRALDVQPPRPWTPQLSWMLNVKHSEADLWVGVERSCPRVVLAPASAWDSSLVAGAEYGVPRLRWNYREAGRFRIAVYKQSPTVDVVGLLRNEGPCR